MSVPDRFVTVTADARRRSLFGHPTGLIIICLAGMWEIFALFGSRTVLVYYLADELHYSQVAAVQIYAWSSAASVVFSVAGGALADSVLGLRRAVVVGSLALAMGEFVMVSPALLFAGLFFIAMGDGLMKPALIAQIDLLYADEDPRRDRAFTHFKVGCNVGAVLAPILCGLAAARWGWGAAFVLAGAGALLSVVLYSLGSGFVPSSKIKRTDTQVSAGAVAESYSRSARTRVLAVAWLAAVLFWMAYDQLGSTVALWAENDLDRSAHFLSADFIIPAAWFQSVNPLMIFVFAPFVSWLWRRRDKVASTGADIRKMATGALLLAASFAVLSTAAAAAGVGRPGWLWLVAALAPLTVAELYLEPIGQALFTRLAPQRKLSIYVGLWLTTTMVGFIASGWLGNLWGTVHPAAFFTLATSVALTGAAILLAGRVKVSGKSLLPAD